MKTKAIFLLTGVMILILSCNIIAQNSYKVLVPTGKMKNNLRVLAYLPDNDERKQKSEYLFQKTFMSESVKLYEMIQQYLVNKGDKKFREPAYLLLSNHQGGFPMQGFYLETKDSVLDRYKTFYIDMPDIEKDYTILSSMTQIFPHEMAHLYFRILAPQVQEGYNASSADIHYFSLPTNYLTAFNEGFAEHFENLSRLNEKAQDVRDGTERDTRKLEKVLPAKVARLDRDFRLPLRLQYYRAGLLLWFQKYEDYKRYQWSLKADLSKTNKSYQSGNAEKSILYRNLGLGNDGNNQRNTAQIASTEGVINSFFIHLAMTDLKNRYMEPAEYYPFLLPADTAGFDPRSLNPVENHCLKIFTAFTKQMDHARGDTSFLQMYINAYCRQFPEEKAQVEKIYREVTGLPYNPEPISEIWLLKEDQPHSFLVMDQFGGNKDPYYTLNLNTAEACDLSVFGISEDEIEALISWRDKNNGFRNIADLKNVQGLSKATATLLINAHESLKKTEGQEEEGGGLNIFNIFLYNGGRILLNGLIWFGIFMVAFYFIFLHKKYPVRSILLISLQKFLKIYLLILAGLICTVFSNSPVLIFLLILAVLLAIDFLKTRKNNRKRTEVLVTTLVMGAIIIYSMV